MKFPYLDVNDGLKAAFTLAWKMTDNDAEHWSARFVQFKQKEEKALYGAARVMGTALPGLIKKLGLDPARTVIIPALSSAERTASKDRHIPRIGAAISKKYGHRYEAGAVSKLPHPPIRTGGTAAARKALLDNAKYKAEVVDADAVMLVDDFITRGDTLSHTALALRAAKPGLAVYGVGLGKTERLSWRPDITNNHVPNRWDALWNEGEQAYLQNQSKKT